MKGTTSSPTCQGEIQKTFDAGFAPEPLPTAAASCVYHTQIPKGVNTGSYFADLGYKLPPAIRNHAAALMEIANWRHFPMVLADDHAAPYSRAEMQRQLGCDWRTLNKTLKVLREHRDITEITIGGRCYLWFEKAYRLVKTGSRRGMVGRQEMAERLYRAMNGNAPIQDSPKTHAKDTTCKSTGVLGPESRLTETASPKNAPIGKQPCTHACTYACKSTGATKVPNPLVPPVRPLSTPPIYIDKIDKKDPTNQEGLAGELTNEQVQRFRGPPENFPAYALLVDVGVDHSAASEMAAGWGQEETESQVEDVRNAHARGTVDDVAKVLVWRHKNGNGKRGSRSPPMVQFQLCEGCLGPPGDGRGCAPKWKHREGLAGFMNTSTLLGNNGELVRRAISRFTYAGCETGAEGRKVVLNLPLDCADCAEDLDKYANHLDTRAYTNTHDPCHNHIGVTVKVDSETGKRNIGGGVRCV